ncbi:Ig-like domain-containing protein [Poseidonocella sedimentorum]|uniref:Uncharacterized protein n=1 Tax=Poseidonocella sedimentorum TaxID=871652 RepID=A0A1I6ENF2_9RHOB|nr:Ig-like domain-containing protein [Poseidonocella sedimentorum]SFR19260.1 hypothetical protein SAMN04515673_11616 [Poseidonocella sedimentorum]
MTDSLQTDLASDTVLDNAISAVTLLPETLEDALGDTLGGIAGDLVSGLLPDVPLVASVIGGRVTTLDLPQSAFAADIVGVRVLEAPEAGNLTVNPDNSLALVMTGHNNSQTELLDAKLEVIHADGTTSQLDIALTVAPTLQEAGWGEGDHYMLQTDAAGDVVVEHGTEHRKIYVSDSDAALSRADIAAMEGLDESDITGNWLSKHPSYGSSPATALKADAGMALWYEITDRDNDPNSHWLLFERGYDYGDVGRLVARGAMGESELHPQLIGAYGEGDRPVIASQVQLFQDASENIVVRDLALTDGAMVFGSDNVLFDNVQISGDELNVQKMDGFTLRNSEVLDVVHDTPVNDSDTWDALPNRKSGIYVSQSSGVLLETTLYDHNGWVEGYDYNLSTDGVQPPSIYSHNVYIQYNNTDVTFRDNITMRAASFGAQIRSGGYIEDNVFLDNNAALNNFGGNYGGAGYIGNYSLYADNLITSGAHKTIAELQGALTLGLGDFGNLSGMVDTIIAHLADPANAAEQLEKYITHTALQLSSVAEHPVYNDTIVYNWVGGKHIDDADEMHQNIDGLDTDLLDATTIQLFTAALLGTDTASIADLAEYLRATADGESLSADDIIAFFQAGFGIAPEARTEAETLRFVPNPLSDGIRWDNRLNWSTEDLPGTVAGDSVALAGNWVTYGGTTTLDGLDLGAGGRLSVSQGYLATGSLSTGGGTARVEIDGAGQLWSGAYGGAGLLELDVAGGRFANTGDFTGRAELTLSDNAQAILASAGGLFSLGAGSSLTLAGSALTAGVDGAEDGEAALVFDEAAALRFIADAEGFSSLTEFYSGHFSAPAEIHSTLELGGATLTLDVSAFTATTTQTLIEVDALSGSFGEIKLVGLGAKRDALLAYNYEHDTVSLTLGEASKGSGTLTISTTHEDGWVPNAGPEAAADSYETGYGERLVITTGRGLLANDADPDGDTLATLIETGPANGALRLGAAGGFLYTPDAGFSGTDSFTYLLSDGRGGQDSATVSITVGTWLDSLDRVEGTNGRDFLIGSDADEVIDSQGGRADTLTGGGGADVFDLTAAFGDGTRNSRTIADFTPGEDLLDLGGHEITAVRVASTRTLLYVGEERDTVILKGINTFDDDFLL